MTRPTSIDRIKEALDAGPTPGIWEIDGIGVSSESVQGIAKCNDSIASPRWGGSDFATSAHCKANAAFIAACNPSAIKELLAYVEGLERALGRISHRCPAYEGEYTRYATPSDFGNSEDYAREMQKLDDAVTGDIARAAIAKDQKPMAAIGEGRK